MENFELFNDDEFNDILNDEDIIINKIPFQSNNFIFNFS